LNDLHSGAFGAVNGKNTGYAQVVAKREKITLAKDSRAFSSATKFKEFWRNA
jgi:hypothetical protein